MNINIEEIKRQMAEVPVDRWGNRMCLVPVGMVEAMIAELETHSMPEDPPKLLALDYNVLLAGLETVARHIGPKCTQGMYQAMDYAMQKGNK